MIVAFQVVVTSMPVVSVWVSVLKQIYLCFLEGDDCLETVDASETSEDSLARWVGRLSQL